jgi:hypothetical protein
MEHPEVGLLVISHRAMALERAIHAVLRLRGQTHHTSPGREWFYTSPEDVKDIVLTVTQGLTTHEMILFPPYQSQRSPTQGPPSTRRYTRRQDRSTLEEGLDSMECS